MTMKLRMAILPILLASLAAAFIVYHGLSVAEETTISSGGAGDQYGAAASQYAVPEDIVYASPVESVTFSHQVHAVDLGLACSSCHTGIFQMKAHNVEAQPDFNMKGLAEGKYCGSCHSSSNSAAFASDTQCARCHSGVKGLEGREQAAGSAVDQYNSAANQ